MLEQTTRTGLVQPFQDPTSPTESRSPALCVIWSLDEPAHVGEVLLAEEGAEGRFGRRTGVRNEGHRRLELVRQRPSLNQVVPPLESPNLSRDQLLIRLEAGRLHVRNIGRCTMLHNGVKKIGTIIEPGDLIELESRLLLLCVDRPAVLPPMPEDTRYPLPPFGKADAFGLVGESPALWEVRRQIAFLVRRDGLHLLLLGASGTGKELVAHAIHALSNRAKRTMVSRNAATIPEGLIDAELFGNVRNYPNPGMHERPGLIGAADGSTLYLDEFGEMPHALQAHLLRVLDQGGEYQRLGEATLRHSDLQLIAATNRPVESLKHDVVARLTRFELPDLNKRREDIPLIVAHEFRRRALEDPTVARRFFVPPSPDGVPRIAPSTLAFLVGRFYTNHVRELFSLIWEAIVSSQQRDFLALPFVQSTGTPQGGDSARALDDPAGTCPQPLAETDASRTVEPLTPEETRRLEVMRRHAFVVSECIRDPEYPVSRMTANTHLVVLFCKVLCWSGWRIDRTVFFLAGPYATLRGRIEHRLGTILGNFRDRLRDEGEEHLRASLANSYRSSAVEVEAVVEAIVDGRL